MRIEQKTQDNIVLVLEILISIFLYSMSYLFFEGCVFPSNDYRILLVCMIFSWSVLLKLFNLARIFKVNPYSYIFTQFTLVMACGYIVLLVFVMLLNLSIKNNFLVGFIFSDFVGMFITVSLIYHFVKKRRQKGYSTSNVIIIGDKNIGNIINKLETNLQWGYTIQGLIIDDENAISKYESRYPIYTSEELEDVIVNHPIDEILYCSSFLNQKIISDLVYKSLELGITLRISSQFLSLASTKAQLFYIGETPYFTFQNTPRQSMNLFIKKAFDKVFSFFVLLILSPFFLLIAIAIKIDSKGPVFFKQTRVGLRGREFQIYKFRSMCDHAEDMLDELKAENEQEGPVFKIKNDKRITRVGRFLRKTSLDELPQFINVFKGEMSVVGPRPPLPQEVKEYKRWQNRRLSMNPGITCIWQVSGRNNIPFDQWMKLDLQYIDTWSIALDIMIILKTIKTVIRHDGQ